MAAEAYRIDALLAEQAVADLLKGQVRFA